MSGCSFIRVRRIIFVIKLLESLFIVVNDFVSGAEWWIVIRRAFFMIVRVGGLRGIECCSRSSNIVFDGLCWLDYCFR